MAVRLRMRIIAGEKEAEAIALVNSGYEADTPQLLIPVKLAKELGYWPPPEDSIEATFDTAGGPLKVWIVKGGANVKVVCRDAESSAVKVDIVVSQLADEPLISDKLAGELKLVVEDFAEGLWRFRWEEPGKLRRSEEPYTTH